MNEVQVLNKIKAPGNLPQGLSGVEMALWMILVEKGEKRLYGIPVLDALETGSAKSFIAVKLRDETGKEITNAEPISVASYGTGNGVEWWSYSELATIFVGFSDNKIRTYSMNMTPTIAYGTKYYYTVSSAPDSLWDSSTGHLWYCSSSENTIGRITQGTNNTVVYTLKRKSGDSWVDYTYNPTAISYYLACSGNLNIASYWIPILAPFGENWMSLGEYSISGGSNYTESYETPGFIVGMATVNWYFGGTGGANIGYYLSSTDGNIYKAQFEAPWLYPPPIRAGTFTIVDQFIGKINQGGIHIGYKIPYIKVTGQSKDGYMKKSGATYTEAVASTPVVTINGGSSIKYVGTRLTGGNYEIYRSYLSFDTEFIDFTPTVIHLYLKTVSLTVRDMEILVYEMPAHDVLTSDHWGSVGRLLARKHVCAYHSIYLPVDTDLSNGLYVEIRGSQEETNSYIQNDLITISAYELRLFS